MSRYRVERGGGVRDEESGRVIRPSDPAWAAEYVPWLEAGNDPDPPEPMAGPSVDELRAEARARANAARERAMELGVSWGGETWDADLRSRANLTAVLAAISAGVPLPPGFTWRTLDNRDVAMDAGELRQLGAAMLEHVNGCYRRSWALKAAIDATPDPAAVDVLAGWPREFPERRPNPPARRKP